jgi:hypothetical protein
MYGEDFVKKLNLDIEEFNRKRFDDKDKDTYYSLLKAYKWLKSQSINCTEPSMWRAYNII